MNRSELESKHLAELHVLAAEAGIERYRMLSRAELVQRLSGGGGDPAASERSGDPAATERGGDRPPRQRRDRGGRQRRERSGPRQGRAPRQGREAAPEAPGQPPAPPSESAGSGQAPPAQERPRRRRRRRRFGRRPKTVRVHDLLLPPDGGRQTIVYGESREACTALLREIAAEIADSKGPDPIGLLIDPSPEELAEWKRDASKAEIVSAGQPRHADDALAQAVRRAEGGEDVIFLIDSLSRLADSFGNPEDARALFDAGRGVAVGSGSLTVVAAVERPAQ